MRFKENVIKPGMAIHCPKEEDANTLLEHLDTLGYRWLSNTRLTEKNLYHDCGGETCYFINYSKEVTYDDCDSYREEGYTITEFSDLIEIESKFKVGDKVRIKENLMKNGVYGELAMQEDMMIWRGSEVNVSEVTENGEYALKSLPYYWSAEMLELVKKSTEMSAVEVLEWFRENYKNYDTMRKVFGHDLAFRRIIVDNSPQKIIENITAYEAAKKTPKPVEVEWVDFYGIFDHEGQLMEYYDNLTKTEFEKEFRKYIEEHGNGYHAKVERQCRVKEDGVSE